MTMAIIKQISIEMKRFYAAMILSVAASIMGFCTDPVFRGYGG